MTNFGEDDSEKNLTWEQIFDWWSGFMEEYDIKLDNLFQEDNVKTNQSGGCYDEHKLYWWPKSKLKETLVNL